MSSRRFRLTRIRGEGDGTAAAGNGVWVGVLLAGVEARERRCRLLGVSRDWGIPGGGAMRVEDASNDVSFVSTLSWGTKACN